jgi:hypothetical protein
MAVKEGSLVLGCDWCEKETSEFETDTEAAEEGWWITLGLARGEVRELAFCRSECRDSYLEYYAE